MGSVLSLFNISSNAKPNLEINDLNDDELLAIFSFLDLKHRLILSEVCLRWSTLISRLFQSQSSLVFTRHSNLQWQYWSTVFLKETYSYSHLSLVSDSNEKTIIESVISMSTNLKSINFVGIYFENSLTPIRIIINNCDSDLTHCDFTHVLNHRNNSQDVRILVTVEEMKQFVNKYPNIRLFGSQGSWFRFTEESLTILMKGFKDLENLSLDKRTVCNSEREITGDYFGYINKKICVLKINQQILGISGLMIICERLTSLIELRVDVIKSLNDIKLIGNNLTNLKCLSFEMCLPKPDQTEAFQLLSQLTYLEELDISMGKELEFNIIDSDLQHLMTKCNSIRYFRLRGSITDSPFKFIDICWPRLERLSIIPTNETNIITDDSLNYIAKLQNLTHLDIRNSAIGDLLVHVINSCKKLHFINVCGTKVSDVLLNAFINAAKNNAEYEYQIKRARTAISQHYNRTNFPSNLNAY